MILLISILQPLVPIFYVIIVIGNKAIFIVHFSLSFSLLRPGIKPNTVLYGSSLPLKFFQSCDEDFPQNCDLLIVIGTSLLVGPANLLVHHVSSSTPRLIVNIEPVGMELGIKYTNDDNENNPTRDYFLGGSCDEQLLQLCQELNWIDDLKRYREEMCPESQLLLDSLEEH